MPLVKSITPKRINVLGVSFLLFSILLTALNIPAFSQDNSPYTRYGLGDIVPQTNINSRSMGGISAAYSDFLSINFNNPASYGSFFVAKEPGAKKIAYGRAVLDVGINIENRTLKEPNNVGKFTASNALFSHVQVGFPLKENWGLSFGLRPVTRVSYKLFKEEALYDPNSNQLIDSAVTIYQGSGGSYLASIGTGFRIKVSDKTTLALGVNGGYFFGRKDISTRRTILNDSLTYNSGNFQTVTSYGKLYANAGLQLQALLKRNLALTIGAYGNRKQQLNARQDILRETYIYDQSAGNVRLDSVYDQKNIKGNIDYPLSVTGGFVLEKGVDFNAKKGGWLVGIDYEITQWSNYRFYDQSDPTVNDSWKLKIGTQLRPLPKPNRYFSNVAYRAGAFVGRDYIQVQNKLPVFGVSVGLGLPVVNYSQLSAGQTILNICFEFIRRGNNDNLLKENLFRLSLGLSLSDSWFYKKRYE